MKPKILRGIIIGHLNINHLYNKTHDLNILLNTYNPSVLNLNETWLSDNINTDELFIQNNYNIYRLDRSHKPGGGLITLINCKHKSLIENSIINCNIELLHTIFYVHTKPISIVNIYPN